MKKLIYGMLLAVGLMACNSNKGNDVVPNEEGSTYVGITLNFASGMSGVRALPEDYNDNGKWEGRDEIKTVTVFLVNETKKTIDYSKFNVTSFDALADINGVMTLKPNLAVKATPGEKVKAYVVVNDENDKITQTLKDATYAEFEGKFNVAVDAVASNVSKVDAATKKEVILMTNDIKPTAESVAPNITKEQAIAGTNNNMNVKVSRVVSRGIVTMKNGLMDQAIDVNDANGKKASTITIKEIKYSIGASNKKFYPMAQKTTWATPDPVYTFVPNSAADWKAGLGGLDYSQVATHSVLQEIADIKNPTVVEALSKETDSKFVLPLTHADGNYRKGNTTYFEIRCTFVPDQIDDVAYNDGPKTVYLGTNDGKFYSTREKAVKSGQGATQYKDGVMKYVLWLNPDKPYNGTEKITMSPVVRNQIYHAHISSFNSIGVPSNPLNPGTNPDPTNPDTIKDPDDPDDPSNPKNPIDPKDPLQVKDTYISATIQVLNWGIHSYEVGLGSDIY